MALKLVKNIFKQIKAKPLEKPTRLFLILSLVTATLVALFLTSTDYSFVGILILFFLILPLTVATVEFNSVLETDPNIAHPRVIALQFFKKSFRSPRMIILIGFRTLLWLLLINAITFLLTVIGMSIFVFSFDASFVQLLNDFSALMATGANATVLQDFLFANEVLLNPYVLVFSAITQFSFFASFLYLVIFNVIKVYADIFIHKRPSVTPRVMYKQLFGESNEKKLARRSFFFAALVPFSLFALVYGLSVFFISSNISNPYNHLIILSRAQLIGFLVFALFIPYLLRATYFIFHHLSELKKKEVLLFTINEVTIMLQMADLPEQSRKLLEFVKKMRELELQELDKTTDPNVFDYEDLPND